MTPRTQAERYRLVRVAPALTFALAFGTLTLADCAGAASCDAVCDNVLDKCFDDAFGLIDEDAVRNDCMEQCAQRSDTVPEKCAAERDEVLSCLAQAESIDCDEPQLSAACSDANQELAECGGSGGGASTGSAGTGQPCDNDDDNCPTGLCNWKTGVCSTPGDIGASCQRDEECAGDLCNWVTSMCAVQAEIGTACQRDEECTSDLCNWNTGVCAVPAALGMGCQRDEECTTGLCNWTTSSCSTPGAPGGPCQRDEECASNQCADNDTCL